MNTTAKKITLRQIPLLFSLVTGVLLFSSCTTYMAAETAAGENKMLESNEAMRLDIAIEAQAQYVLEFPVFIAIKIRNTAADTDYYDLPKLDILSPIDSIAVELKPVDGRPALRLGPSFFYRDKNLFRTELLAGQSHRMLFDLTGFGQPLHAGQYRLTVTLFAGPGVTPTSNSVVVDFKAPAVAEQVEAIRLRRMNVQLKKIDTGSWTSFLSRNKKNIVVAKSVSKQALHQLAPYLLLDNIAHSAEPVANFPRETFRNNWGPVVSAEFAAYEYEIVVARGNQSEIDALRARLLLTWPDLTKQLDLIDKGEGILSMVRKMYGVEH